MKEYVELVLIHAVAPTLTAIVIFYVRHLHHTMNSKMDRLLEVTARAARAEGVLEEKTRRDEIDNDRINKTLT